MFKKINSDDETAQHIFLQDGCRKHTHSPNDTYMANIKSGDESRDLRLRVSERVCVIKGSLKLKFNAFYVKNAKNGNQSHIKKITEVILPVVVARYLNYNAN